VWMQRVQPKVVQLKIFPTKGVGMKRRILLEKLIAPPRSSRSQTSRCWPDQEGSNSSSTRARKRARTAFKSLADECETPEVLVSRTSLVDSVPTLISTLFSRNSSYKKRDCDTKASKTNDRYDDDDNSKNNDRIILHLNPPLLASAQKQKQKQQQVQAQAAGVDRSRSTSSDLVLNSAQVASKRNRITITHLPKCMGEHIASFLYLREICRIRRVSKRMYRLASLGSTLGASGCISWEGHLRPLQNADEHPSFLINNLNQNPIANQDNPTILDSNSSSNINIDILRSPSLPKTIDLRPPTFQLQKLLECLGGSRIRTADLRSCQASERSLKTFLSGSADSLEQLDLRGTPCTSSIFPYLNKCVNLKDLRISQCETLVRDARPASPSGTRSPRRGFREAGGLRLLKLNKLQNLDLSGSQLTRMTVWYMTHNPGNALLSLNLSRTTACDGCVFVISQTCPALRQLSLSHTNISDLFMDHLARGCKDLRLLDVSGCGITDNTLFRLINEDQIFRNSGLKTTTDKEMEKTKLENLQYLCIQRCPRITYWACGMLQKHRYTIQIIR